jgi:hypothetical protein
VAGAIATLAKNDRLTQEGFGTGVVTAVHEHLSEAHLVPGEVDMIRAADATVELERFTNQTLGCGTPTRRCSPSWLTCAVDWPAEHVGSMTAGCAERRIHGVTEGAGQSS